MTTDNQSAKAGERRVETISGVEYAFRWCPAGTFMMGSPEDEEKRYGNESQHEVRLTKGFWLLETPVTQLMWQSVMGANPSRFKGDNLPVEQVNWYDCQKFIVKLNELFESSLRFRLPSEAEWEYACRAGTTVAYSGNGNLDEMGWYYNNSGYCTHEVKTKNRNALGLYDMHGNVNEWCEDWYGAYQSDSVTDPRGPNSGWHRVIRGGSWGNNPEFCRSASRDRLDSEDLNDDLGFRLALSSTH